ncbi:hypothetical protein Bca101_050512 [Brassica carinata]
MLTVVLFYSSADVFGSIFATVIWVLPPFDLTQILLKCFISLTLMHFLHLNKKRNPSLFPHISRANSLSLRLHFSSVVFAGQSLHGFHRKNLQLSSFMASRVKSIG